MLAAIFHAQYCDIERFIFDINKKNKAQKTVFDLALANGNNDITSAVILYGAPKTEGYETLLVKTKINLHAIYQEREKLIREALQEQARLLQRTVAATIANTQEMMTLTEYQTRIEGLTAELGQQTLLNQFLIMQICSHIRMPLPDGFSLPGMSLAEPGRASFVSSESPYRFFAGMPAARLTDSAHQLSVEERLIKLEEEFDILKREVATKSTRITQLEQEIDLLKTQVRTTFSPY